MKKARRKRRLTDEERAEAERKRREERKNPKGFRHENDKKMGTKVWEHSCPDFMKKNKGFPRIMESDNSRDNCEGYCTTRIYNNLKVGDKVKAIPTFTVSNGGYNRNELDAEVIQINEKRHWVRLRFGKGYCESFRYGENWQYKDIKHNERGEY